MEKLKGSNLKVKKGIKTMVALGIGAFLATGLLGCKSNDLEIMNTISISEALEKTENETYIDDVLSIQDNQFEEITTLEKLEDLENSIRRYHILENIEFSESGYRKYSDKELEKLKNYSLEDVKEMVELLETDSLSENERVKMLQLMYWMNKEDKKIIDTEGLGIVEGALLETMKAVTCDAAGMKPEDYNMVTIKERPTNAEEKIRLTVEKDDEDIVYNVNYNSLYQRLIDNIYDIQNTSSQAGFDEKLNLIENGINYIKKSCVAGVQVKSHSMLDIFGEDYLEAEISESKAESKIRIK